jgi:hypothetical protein
VVLARKNIGHVSEDSEEEDDNWVRYISGLVSEISRRNSSDVYLAGLWKSILLQDVLWTGAQSRWSTSILCAVLDMGFLNESHIASTSWGGFDPGYHIGFKKFVELIDFNVIPKHGSPYGELEPAPLFLRGRVIPAFL